MKRIFLAAEALLWLSFLTLDLLQTAGTVSLWLKFSSILLVLLAGLTAARTRDGRLVAAALVLTVAADVFLLVLDRHYAIGVALFLCVQALYTVRLCRMTETSCVLHLTARAMLSGFAAWFLRARLGALEALAGAYIVWFFMNLAQAFAAFAQSRSVRSARFCAGLALFFLCDLCVGVHNLPRSALSGFADVAMWAFYLPGQVLIVLSTDCFGGEVCEE